MSDNAGGLIVVDVLGYDGWPAMATLQHRTTHSGVKRYCATLCGSKAGGVFVKDIIAAKAYSMARGEKLLIQGFPPFKALVKDVMECDANVDNVAASYSVTAPLPDGSLAIQEAGALRVWVGCSMFCLRHSWSTGALRSSARSSRT